MRPSPLLSAAAAAALLAAVAGPATAATEPAEGVGQALSSGSLVQLTAAGQVLEALRLQLPTSTVDTPSALVRVTPLLSGGQAVGAPVEVGAGQSRELPSQSGGVPGLLELVSPTGSLSAVLGPDGPSSTLATGLGDLRLLGLDVLGDGALDVTSAVTATGSTGTKHLVVDGLALPTLLDLLTALGLDLSALPVDTLLDLVDELDLVNGQLVTRLRELVSSLGLTTVTDLVDVLEGGLTDALPDLSGAELESLLGGLDADPDEVAAVTDVQTTIGGLQEVLAGLVPSSTLRTQGTTPVRGSLLAVDVLEPIIGGTPIVVPTVPGLPTGGGTDIGGDLQDVLDGVVTVDPVSGVPTLPVLDPVLDLIDDPALLETITGLIGDLQGVTTVEQLVQVLTDLVTELVTTVTDLVTDLLDGLLGELPTGTDLPALLDTPLLQIGAMDVRTLARTGDGETADVTGTVEGVEVLGTDALEQLLGSSTVDVTTLLSQVDQLNGLLTGTLDTVTDVLGDLTGLVVPMPTVEVLDVVEELAGPAGGTRTARAGVEALRLEWALSDLRIPAALSTITGGVTGGLPLGGLRTSALPTGQLTALLSEDLSLVLGDLTDTSAFTAAAAATPGTVTPPSSPTTGTPTTVVPVAAPQLPRTGATSALAALGVALMAAAVVTRRRRSEVAEDLAV